MTNAGSVSGGRSSSAAVSTNALTIAATVASITVAALLYSNHRRKKSNVKQNSVPTEEDLISSQNDEDIVIVTLDDFDKLLHTFGIRPINTLTWFHGNYQQGNIEQYLRQRINLILSKNPWLAGKLMKIRRNVDSPDDGEPVIVYSRTVPADFDPLVIIDPKDSPITRQTSFDDLVGKAGDNGLTLGHKANLAVGEESHYWKVTLVPCSKNPTAHFAIIMSLSHIIGGGSTYYDILKMLFNDKSEVEGSGSDKVDPDSIRSLIIERPPQHLRQPQEEALFGKEELEFPSTSCFGHNFLIGVIRALFHSSVFKSKMKHHLFVIDNDKMEQCKHQAVVQHNSKAVAGSDNKISYVSTNDVLVSWFWKNSLADIGFMNIDCRLDKRISQVSDRHAGNYQRLILYQHQDYQSAGLIRRSLKNDKQMIKRAVTTSIPTYYDCVIKQGHFGMTTNWTSFLSNNSQPFTIGNSRSTTCQQDLHLPLTDVSGFMPYACTEMKIFRPYPGKTAVRLAGYRLPETLIKNVPFASDNEELI